MKKCNSIVLILFLLFFVRPVSAYTGDEVFQEVNQWRTERELAQLKKNVSTCLIASIRVKEIQKDWKHDIKNRFSYLGYRVLGENLSRKFNNPKAVVKAWNDSPNHKKIMESDFKYGCVKCENQYCSFNLIK